MGFFESNPLVFVGAVVLIAEGWIRVRALLFRERALPRDRPSGDGPPRG